MLNCAAQWAAIGVCVGVWTTLIYLLMAGR